MRDNDGVPLEPSPENLAMFDKAVQALADDGLLELRTDAGEVRVHLTKKGRVDGALKYGKATVDGGHRLRPLEPPK
jgi:hypothetical protein